MTMGADDLSGLPADNTARRARQSARAQPLPLKPGQWNAVKLAVGAAKLAIDLNGQTVYERPLEPALGRQFGLFHFKDQTAAQARNVVLRGQWPESLTKEQLAGLTAPDRDVAPVGGRPPRSP